MDGVGVASSVLDLFKAIGPLAGVIILIVIAYFIIREIKKENERTRKTSEALNDKISNAFEELKSDFSQQFSCHEESIRAMEKEIKYIQKEYITKEDHYRDTEGWKTEIQGVRKDMGELPLKILTALKDSKNN